MTETLRSLARALLYGGLLTLAVYHGALLGRAPDPAAAAGRVGTLDSGPLTLQLHGSTPTLAWSPDGSRLAVASSYEYFGFGQLPKQHAAQTGIYVVDPAARAHWRVSRDQGYHPVWLDGRTLAWGHSAYEHGTAGLYVATLTGRAWASRRLGTWKGVNHTGLAAGGKKLVFFSGWPESRGWLEVDPRTARATPLRGASAKGVDAWTPPSGALRSQCLQRVGRVRTGLTATGGFLLETATQNVQVPGLPFAFYTYNGTGTRTSCAVTGHCGPVKPCLSPKGKRLATVSPGPRAGTFTLRILTVPR